MTLDDAVRQLETLNDHAILCVKKPWISSADCVAIMPDVNLAVPQFVLDAGLAYFLEVAVAREVLGVFEDKQRTCEEKVRLLIFYAESDAFPDWVVKS